MSTITIWLCTLITSPLLYEVTLKHRCRLEYGILLFVQLPLWFPHGGIQHAQLRASFGCVIPKHGWLTMALSWDGFSTPSYCSSQSVPLPTTLAGGLQQVFFFFFVSEWPSGGGADYWLGRVRDDWSCTRLRPEAICRSPVLPHVRLRGSPGVRNWCSLGEVFLLSQTHWFEKSSALWFSNLSCQSLCSSFLEPNSPPTLKLPRGCAFNSPAPCDLCASHTTLFSLLPCSPSLITGTLSFGPHCATLPTTAQQTTSSHQGPSKNLNKYWQIALHKS